MTYSLPSAFALLALLAPAASGALLISVSATGGSGHVEDYQMSPSASQLAGRARSTSLGASANVFDGTLSGCPDLCDTFEKEGRSHASADGTTGVLRAFGAGVAANAGGTGIAAIFDTLSFRPLPGFGNDLVLDLWIELDVIATGSSLDAEGSAYALFSFGLGDEWEGPPGSGDFVVHASKYVGYPFDCVVIGPSGAEACRVDNHYMVVLPGLADGVARQFVIGLEAFGGCNSDDCTAYGNASNSAYIGILNPYTSQSGYSYLGLQTQAVPEPETLLMAAIGLALVLARRRRLLSNRSF